MEVVEFVDPARRSGSRGDYMKNRKLFMSSKASDVFKEPPSSVEKHSEIKDEEMFLSDFDSIFRKVDQLVGNSHTNWKDKKKAEQQKAETLGAKPMKKNKMPIDAVKSIGRKRKEREAVKFKEDLASGNYKPAKEIKSSRDRELKVSDGKYRGGVLYVKPLPKASGVESQERPKTSGFKSKSKRKKIHKKKK